MNQKNPNDIATKPDIDINKSNIINNNIDICDKKENMVLNLLKIMEIILVNPNKIIIANDDILIYLLN